MLIYGEDIPILDVLFLYFYPPRPAKYGGSSQAQDSVNKKKRFDCLDFEASLALGFVLCSLELQSSASFWESNILILSTNVYLCAYLMNGFRFT
ncbi:hypothetical protein Tco_0198364 [Tanacetum coccineum]